MSDNAWDDLIEGLTLLRRGDTTGVTPLHCMHDELWVMSDPKAYTPDELARLDELGFFVSENYDTFKSYRFGSA